MWQCMRKSETTAMRAAMYSSAAVTPQSFEFIEYLLWAMEQTDSPEATIRQITGGGQGKLARLKEILTWFENKWGISRTVGFKVSFALT